MAGIDSYSITPATNATIDGGNGTWAEGQLPSTVNNTARQMCADLRAAYNDLMWFQYGTGDQGTGNLAVPGVYASGTSFTITGANVTSVYEVGRRVRAVGTLTGTIYGSITASSYASNVTTVTVAWDSGSLSNETLTISLSQIPVTGSPLRAVTSLVAAAGSLTNVALGIGAVNTGFISPSGSDVAVVQNGKQTAIWDGNGNLGLGVVPSAWDTGRPTLEFGGSVQSTIAFNGNTTNGGAIWQNGYYGSGASGVTNYYVNNGTASLLNVGGSNALALLDAGSGTAGSVVSFSQVLTVNHGGNLGLGTTSPNEKLEVFGALRATSNSAGLNQSNGAVLDYYSGSARLVAAGAASNSTNLEIYTTNNGTSNLVATFDISGNLLVGHTSLDGYYFTYDPSGQYTVLGHNGGTATGAAFEYFNYGGLTIGSITQSGTTGVAFNTTSDEKLKENWRELAHDEVRQRIAGLYVGEHSWKADPKAPRAINFKAQQGHTIHPQAFTPGNDNTPWMRAVGEMEPLLTLGIQHLYAEIDELRAEIAALKSERKAA